MARKKPNGFKFTRKLCNEFNLRPEDIPLHMRPGHVVEDLTVLNKAAVGCY